MNEEIKRDMVHTKIWLEEPESDNSFATKAAFCHGYNVYGDMLGKARWVDMLYLLFKGEAPTLQQAQLLETLAVALANPGPRDQSVHAAMCGGVGGSTSASCLMAALAVGAGHLSGSREIFLAVEAWNSCGTDIESWRTYINRPADDTVSVWPAPEHIPGFDPNGINTTTIVKQTLLCLSKLSPGDRLPWLADNREKLEVMTGIPLALSGVAAAALADLGFDAEQAEILYLIFRLPGAAAHALEQKHYGHKKFPFFSLELLSDPGKEEK
jgi:citrate synthase